MKGLPSFLRREQPRRQLLPLVALAQRGAWELTLAHDRPDHLLIWVTKGQGLALLNGERHGIGVHNALVIPAGNLFSIDLGRQGFAQALVLPPDTHAFPADQPRHLRIRDVIAQTELYTLIETFGREQNGQRDLVEDAQVAYTELICIWLQRQIAQSPGPKRRTATQKLMQAYSARITAHYASGNAMADHAEALDVTPTHLTRVCRSATGRTAAALLTERIVHAARLRLATEDTKINEIASGLGFRSPAYFTRFVQHHTGMTPTQLRQSTGSQNPAKTSGSGRY